MWPACRLPMVGTKTTRPRPLSAERRSAMLEWICMAVLSGISVFGAGIAAILYGGDGAGGGVGNAGGAFHEVADELGLLARRDVESVVQHHDLAGAVLAGTDADGDDLQLRRDLGGEDGRDGFEDDHRRAGILQSLGVVLQTLRGGIALALDLVAAEY